MNKQQNIHKTDNLKEETSKWKKFINKKNINFIIYSFIPVITGIVSLILREGRHRFIYDKINSSMGIIGAIVSLLIYFFRKTDIEAKYVLISTNIALAIGIIGNMCLSESYFPLMLIGLGLTKQKICINLLPIVIIVVSDMIISSFCKKNVLYYSKILQIIALSVFYIYAKEHLVIQHTTLFLAFITLTVSSIFFNYEENKFLVVTLILLVGILIFLYCTAQIKNNQTIVEAANITLESTGDQSSMFGKFFNGCKNWWYGNSNTNTA